MKLKPESMVNRGVYHMVVRAPQRPLSRLSGSEWHSSICSCRRNSIHTLSIRRKDDVKCTCSQHSSGCRADRGLCGRRVDWPEQIRTAQIGHSRGGAEVED